MVSSREWPPCPPPPIAAAAILRACWFPIAGEPPFRLPSTREAEEPYRGARKSESMMAREGRELLVLC